MRFIPLLAMVAGCAPIVIGGGGAVMAPSPVMRADVHVQIDFFGIPLDGAQDVVFVLDHSGSMGGVAAGVTGQDVGMGPITSTLVGLGAQIANGDDGPLPTKMQAARDELVHTLSQMPDGTRFMIVFFDDDLSAFAPRMTTLDPYSRSAAIDFVKRIEPDGSTAAVPALRLAYQAGAARVVLLSDGLANTGGDGDDLLDEARAAMQQGVRFDTVGLGIDQDADLMRTLAAESGGMTVTR